MSLVDEMKNNCNKEDCIVDENEDRAGCDIVEKLKNSKAYILIYDDGNNAKMESSGLSRPSVIGLLRIYANKMEREAA